MKRRLYSLLIVLGLLLPAVGVINAPAVGAANLFKICTGADDGGTNAGTTDVCKEQNSASKTKGDPVVHAISVAIGILAFIIGVASVIVIIVSGLKFVTSQGDPQGVAKARTAIIYALVGLVVAILAGAIVSLVLSNL